MYNSQETVVARATPPGEGAISIIRLSGPDSFYVLSQLFEGVHIKNIVDLEPRKMYYGYIKNLSLEDEVIDEVLVVYLKAPKTYTKEDMVEIHCHGGTVPMREILKVIFSLGVRQAEQGEFTKRAFLNGRIDLTQAEGVIDLITAQTNEFKSEAVKHVKGTFKQELDHIKEELMTIMANLEAKIDFPDEDIHPETNDQLNLRIQQISYNLDKFTASFDKGKILREGIKTVIVGRPNVGKSSLLNVLLGEERAIVTDVPGTTRDVLEEVINLEGIPLKILDTAGIRETFDKVEQMGVDRSKRTIEDADLILAVLDLSEPITKEDEQLLDYCRRVPAIIILNKSDLNTQLDKYELDKLVPNVGKIKISALHQDGIKQLEEHIISSVLGGHITQQEDLIVTNARHHSALIRANKSLKSGMTALSEGMSEDLVSIDIKEAWENIGEVTGDTVSEDIIDEIFERFCIGK